ncbi:PREDICTED: putative B3 domain-containing protein At1g78640 [Prunus mume]|uniref:B3 domain-containing protein At1g78640 n=1 Tax=Prunus mume TaxID=102107 RepID=A0ABM0PFP6_PRUMU|nr:PREDICTED: putative B3 domain-containing protein At1g78640 [Prunus mume]
MEDDYETSKMLALTVSLRNTNPELDQVSTALTLCDPTWNYNTKQSKAEELDPASHNVPTFPPNPKHEKISGTNDTNKELANKKRNLVVLGPRPSPKPRRPWPIRKILKASDLGNSSRLLVPKDAATNHFLRYLDDKFVQRVDSDDGLGVTVQDCDTGTRHQLTFKFWSSAKSYILNGEWRGMFVQRRGLKEKDEIGLYWDASRAMFLFSLLQRA